MYSIFAYLEYLTADCVAAAAAVANASDDDDAVVVVDALDRERLGGDKDAVVPDAEAARAAAVEDAWEEQLKHLLLKIIQKCEPG